MAPVDRAPFTNLRAVLRVPRTVHVLPASRDATESYTSVLTDFDESTVFLTEPSKGRSTMPLEAGDTVRVVYYGDDALYDFSLHVTGSVESARGGLRYTAEIPDRCWRLQRRDSYRLPVRIEARYRPAGRDPAGGDAAVPEVDPERCLLVDISGGRVAFLVDELLEVDSRIELSFSLDGSEPSGGVGERVRVVRAGAAPPRLADGYTYRCAGAFCDLDERTRNRILRYIFLKQIEQLGRRRG